MPELRVTRLGMPSIDSGNHYAEVVPIQINVVYPPGHPRAGRVDTDFNGLARVEEWRTTVYDGLYGATALPMHVRVHAGRAEFMLRSLARYQVIEQRQAPVPQIAVYLAGQRGLVDVPQWVDADHNGRIDWLERQVDSLIAAGRRSPVRAVRAAFGAVTGWEQSWRRDCGGVLPDSPTVIRIGAACLNMDAVNTHRFNMDHELSATLLHEARHVWVYKHPDRALLPRIVDLNPMSRARCRAAGGGVCSGGYGFDDYPLEAYESDAEAFAQRYKDRLP